MQTITSARNNTVMMLSSLKGGKGREEQNAFLIEGSLLVNQALEKGAPVLMLVVADDGAFGEIIGRADMVGIPVTHVARHVMERICDTEHPQGIAAMLRLPKPETVRGQRLLALDCISDPGNLGTMLRSALAFGFNGVLLSSGCADAFSPKCVRAGMGAHFSIQITQGLALADELSKRKDEDFQIVGADVGGSEIPAPYCEKQVLVIGSEAHGLSSDVMKACTYLWRIPMERGTQSLNAAVAASILMYADYVCKKRD